MSHPTDPYEPVDDETVMRPPRRYGPDGGTPHGQAPYGTDPWGPARGRGEQAGQADRNPGPTAPPADTGATWAPPSDTGATWAPPSDTGATWPPGRTAAGHPAPPPYGTPAGPRGSYGTPGGAYGAPGGAYGAPGGAYGAPGAPGAPEDATVVPDRLGPPSDPYAFSPYAAPRRPRGGLIAVLATVVVLVVAGGVVGVLLAGRDDALPVVEATSAAPTPEAPATADPPATPDATDEPEPSPTEDVEDDEPWLDEQYRAGAEMDPTDGPSLAPMSWDFFGDNDYVVNGDRIALTARRDFACDDLPAIPAIAEGLADACEGGGFETRVVAHDGPTVGLDAVVVEVGTPEAAERVVAAHDAARGDDPLADTTGAPHETLSAAVPQPGFEKTFAVLDGGEAPSVMLSTGSVVVLLRLGIGDGLEREQVLPTAQAVGFVVADHEAAQLFGG